MFTTLRLQPPPRRTNVSGRILAIEPNPVRANTLRDLLKEHDLVDLAIVPSVQEAFDAIADRIPDLVITSTFLPPADEAELTTYLRRLPGASHVQVLIVPHFTNRDGAGTPDAPRTSRSRRRPAPDHGSCDLEWVRAQIADYLGQARFAASMSVDCDLSVMAVQPATSEVTAIAKPELRLVRPHDGHIPGEDVFSARAHERRRERRWPSTELPWLWSARTSAGTELKLVDVSNGGVLVETVAKMVPGSTVDFRLIGQDTDLIMPARVLRSTVAQVDALGVRYYIAAAFARELPIMELAPKPAGPSRHAELTIHDLGRLNDALVSTATRVRFEQELRRVLGARDVLIRQTPVVADDGAESIVFSIPGRSGSILQVIFERDHVPSTTQFEILKAAARLAAAVLELAPARARLPEVTEALAG